MADGSEEFHIYPRPLPLSPSLSLSILISASLSLAPGHALCHDVNPPSCSLLFLVLPSLAPWSASSLFGTPPPLPLLHVSVVSVSLSDGSPLVVWRQSAKLGGVEAPAGPGRGLIQRQ